MLAVSIAVQLLIPKPKQKVDRSKAPDAPSVGSDVALPIVYGRSRVGGVFFYGAPLVYYEGNENSGKGSPRKVEQQHYKAPLLGYAISAINPVDVIRIEVNSEIFYDAESQDSKIISRSEYNKAHKFTWQSGNSSQVVHGNLINYEGTSNLPKFKKMSVLWLRDINLNDYGNSYPTVQVIVKTQQKYPTLRSFLLGVIKFSKVNEKSQADFGLDIISVDPRVTSFPFYGAAFSLDGSDPASWIHPHIEAWNLVVKSDNGALIIDTVLPFDDPNYNVQEIEIDSLLGIEGESAFEIKMAGEDKAPTQLALSYIDIDSESTPQVAYSSLGRAEYENSTSYDIKAVLPSQVANTLSERMLRNLWVKSKSITFALPLSYLSSIQNGTIVTLRGSDSIENLQWQIINSSFGEKGFAEYSGLEFSPIHYAFIANNTSLSGLAESAEGFGEIGQVNLKILDIPPLSDSDLRLNPFYALDKGAYTGGVYWYLSQNNINYDYKETLNAFSPIATLQTSTPNLEPDLLYENTSVEVTFNKDSTNLVSVSASDWKKGKQLFSYQNCLFSYKSASFIGSSNNNRWRITGLIAGFRGTGAIIKQLLTTNSDLDVVFIKGNSISPSSLTSAFSNSYFGDYYFKIGESNLDDITDNISEQFFYTHKKALAADVQILPAKVFSSGVIQLRWVGRSTEDNALALMDEIPQPLSNLNGSSYLIKIFNSSNVLVRTASVSNTSIYNYTTANQTADGNLNLVDLKYTISQQSNRDLLGSVSSTQYDTQLL